MTALKNFGRALWIAGVLTLTWFVCDRYAPWMSGRNNDYGLVFMSAWAAAFSVLPWRQSRTGGEQSNG